MTKRIEYSPWLTPAQLKLVKAARALPLRSRDRVAEAIREEVQDRLADQYWRDARRAGLVAKPARA